MQIHLYLGHGDVILRLVMNHTFEDEHSVVVPMSVEDVKRLLVNTTSILPAIAAEVADLTRSDLILKHLVVIIRHS